MGHTGYSTTENVNNIEVTHLHWGLELIFDEEQKESDNEIWIDVYPLTLFLSKHKFHLLFCYFFDKSIAKQIALC